MTYDWTAHVPGEHEIELYSGKFLDLANPDPAVIDIWSIAHGLAKECRYSGQCNGFLSVAQHAAMCSYWLEREGYNTVTQLAGLHHDDSEAFLRDVVRPLKGLLGTAYEELTATMDAAIARSFGDIWPADPRAKIPAVKQADNWALMVEARRRLKSKGRHWGAQSHNWGVETEALDDAGDLDRGEVCWESAAAMYVLRHEGLMGRLALEAAA